MIFYVIDDHPMMRDAIVMSLRRMRPGATILEFDRIDALEKANSKGQSTQPPDLISIDINLPDNDSSSGVQRIRSLYPSSPIAVFSNLPAAEMEDDCVASGADIYIEKSAGAGHYREALEALLTADTTESELLPGEINAQEVQATGVAGAKLSKRQKQLITMIDRGLTNRQMSVELGLSEQTVKVHLWRMFRRIGVNNRTQALHFAREHGLYI
ncbi:MAG: response regulator transcription factor [Burkholderiaceae bacterium]|nr:MAG: response regulator transcription factor [Burkholderiaceae bacterium]TBR76683.1 MAG: response regulator transcription factor [Burkholderiaceae bacterium]